MSDEKTAKCIKVGFGITILIVLAIIFLPGIVNVGATGQAETALRKEIESESGGNIHLSDFRKTDGQSGEVLGVKA